MTISSVLKNLATVSSAAFVVLAAVNLGEAKAATIAYTSNPTSNSIDWATDVTGFGGTVNSNVNFNSHPVGALQSNFYLGSDGVTLTNVGDSNTVAFGSGPNNGNTFSTPLSPGEGPNAPSNYLFDNGDVSSLTISFNAPVLGVGLSIIDYFNPFNDNPLTIEAFTGQNGVGNSLGIFSSVAFNFQPNNKYFMGLISTDENIGSLVFRDVNTNTGDTTGIDNIVFARGTTQSIPTPALLPGLIGMGVALLRKRKAEAVEEISKA